MNVRIRLWKWPDGLAWRLTDGMTRASRRRRYHLFLGQLKPTASTRILDVGVNDFQGRATNFLEEQYPWPGGITAVAKGEAGEFNAFQRRYPEVRLVLADGRDMPFADDEFDIVFSNAVIEHVGTRVQQQQFLSECLRVGSTLFLSTPNAWFPVDAHTLLPFVHWLPTPVRFAIYRRCGRAYYADVAPVNLLSKRDLVPMLPHGTHWRIIADRTLGVAMTLTLVAHKGGR